MRPTNSPSCFERWAGEAILFMFSRSRCVRIRASCARDEHRQLVGYVSAFSDGALSTMLGELGVHPNHRRRGVASMLLRAVEEQYRGIPIYAKALGDAKHFFLARGYKVPSVEMTVLFKRPTSTDS